MSSYSVQVLTDKLNRLSMTQDSIETLSLWMIRHKSKAQTSVSIWLDEFKKGDAEKKLNLLYLTNDVLQNGRRKGATEFLDLFKDALRVGIPLIRGQKIQGSVERMLKIWRERKVYDNRFLGELDLIIDPTRGAQSEQGRPVEFKLSLLEDALIELRKFEAELKVKSSHLSNLRVDIKRPTSRLQQLKDKSDGESVSREFNIASQKLQDYCECLGVEVNERINILDMLRDTKAFTAYKLAEYKKTVLSYKDLGERVETLKEGLHKRLNELERAQSTATSDPSANKDLTVVGDMEIESDSDTEAVDPPEASSPKKIATPATQQAPSNHLTPPSIPPPTNSVSTIVPPPLTASTMLPPNLPPSTVALPAPAIVPPALPVPIVHPPLPASPIVRPTVPTPAVVPSLPPRVPPLNNVVPDPPNKIFESPKKGSSLDKRLENIDMAAILSKSSLSMDSGPTDNGGFTGFGDGEQQMSPDDKSPGQVNMDNPILQALYSTPTPKSVEPKQELDPDQIKITPELTSVLEHLLPELSKSLQERKPPPSTDSNPSQQYNIEPSQPVSEQIRTEEHNVQEQYSSEVENNMSEHYKEQENPEPMNEEFITEPEPQVPPPWAVFPDYQPRPRFPVGPRARFRGPRPFRPRRMMPQFRPPPFHNRMRPPYYNDRFHRTNSYH